MNFDVVANIYDDTRGLPAEVVERVADSIVAATGAETNTTFLEPGVGTGRIALPFVQRGYRYIGVDISERMMAQFREKSGEPANLILLTGDVTALPVPDASVDVLLTVHLLHLVPEWRKGLAEIRRVLTPEGYFVLGNDGGLPESPGRRIRSQWWKIARELDAPLRPEYGMPEAVNAELTAQGCYTAVYCAAQWTREVVPLELLEAMRTRTFSHSWHIPDATLEAMHQRMLPWAREEFGDPSQPIDDPQEFTVSVSRFPQENSV